MAPIDDNVMGLRREFPALQQTLEGRPVTFFDGPAGTQVHRSVIDSMVRYYTEANSNVKGHFEFSRRTDRIIAAARGAMADFVHARRPEEIVFGPSMTALTFNLSRAIERTLAAGDEIVVTSLDHDANVAPWMALRERGAVVRVIDFDPTDCTLDLGKLHDALNERTRVVAVGAASNAVGTVNDVRRIAEWAHRLGAWIYVDAVQYAPHAPIDVQAFDADFLVCSAYKFFGPHLGVLWGRYELLDRLPACKVLPAGDGPPDKFEQGTGNFEAMAGATAAVDYLASVGRRFGESTADASRREEIVSGMAAIRAYEGALTQRLIAGLQRISGARIYGIIDPDRADDRLPVVSFTLEGLSPSEVARRLGDEAIFVWNGDFYAVHVVERLGLAERGGLIRIGINHYNTAQEVDRLLAAVERIAP
jgi:cysteine desulfurase family protein (TIGR01976 family)